MTIVCFNKQFEGELSLWKTTNPSWPPGNLMLCFITCSIRHALLDQQLYVHVGRRSPVSVDEAADRNLIRALCAPIHVLCQRVTPRSLLFAVSLWINTCRGWVLDLWLIKHSAVFGSGNNQSLVWNLDYTSDINQHLCLHLILCITGLFIVVTRKYLVWLPM